MNFFEPPNLWFACAGLNTRLREPFFLRIRHVLVVTLLLKLGGYEENGRRIIGGIMSEVQDFPADRKFPPLWPPDSILIDLPI